MKPQKTLALILGATILSGTMCQTTMQAYACPIGDQESTVLSDVQKDEQVEELTDLKYYYDYERIIKELKNLGEY